MGASLTSVAFASNDFWTNAALSGLALLSAGALSAAYLARYAPTGGTIDLDKELRKKRAAARAQSGARRKRGDDAHAPSEATRKLPSGELRLMPGAVPKGQRKVGHWVVLDLGTRPSSGLSYDVTRVDWRLTVGGSAAAAPKAFSMAELEALGTREYECDWHCVTGWTAHGLRFQGVPLAALMDAVGVREGWQSLTQICADGYAANIDAHDVEDAFLALSYADGSPLEPDHGGVRLVAPGLFGWKSGKWPTDIRFQGTHEPGFWEHLGCNMRGRVALDERWSDAASPVWNVLIGIMRVYFAVLPAPWVLRLMQVSGGVLGQLALRPPPAKR